jgi:hypothetical protein
MATASVVVQSTSAQGQVEPVLMGQLATTHWEPGSLGSRVPPLGKPHGW